ncbi:hypothetical protein ACFQ1S_06835 [Kibdelosporangium lantanae]|uniref:Acetaldehyde dehydrogenase n=1 Tax=Kibdelosporangium lantanae TaxID=1497396 RepID=A0ABW3M6T6_9PSEU
MHGVTSTDGVHHGRGRRRDLHEFTRTTSRGIEVIGGAEKGKAIIVLNPASPPMIMRDTIICAIPDSADTDKVAESVVAMVNSVAEYVPGYRLLNDPQFDRSDKSGPARVTVFIEVEGAGDFLPPYAGNLDIMTAAAVRVGEQIALGMQNAGQDHGHVPA